MIVIKLQKILIRAVGWLKRVIIIRPKTSLKQNLKTSYYRNNDNYTHKYYIVYSSKIFKYTIKLINIKINYKIWLWMVMVMDAVVDMYADKQTEKI